MSLCTFPRLAPIPSIALLFGLFGAVAGCGNATISVPPSTDAAVTDVPPAQTDVPVVADLGPGCRLSDGSFCAMAASCPSPDGCNTCSCGPNGVVACTARACVDAGPPVDATCAIECAAPPPGCHYEGPSSCSPPTCPRLVCGDAGAPIVCLGHGVGSFPTFDRSCHTDTDCFVAMHQTDCCGSIVAMGLSASQRVAFEAAETLCDRMYPSCACDPRPPFADDGRSGSAATIAVRCDAGVCGSFVAAF